MSDSTLYIDPAPLDTTPANGDPSVVADSAGILDTCCLPPSPPRVQVASLQHWLDLCA